MRLEAAQRLHPAPMLATMNLSTKSLVPPIRSAAHCLLRKLLTSLPSWPRQWTSRRRWSLHVPLVAPHGMACLDFALLAARRSRRPKFPVRLYRAARGQTHLDQAPQDQAPLAQTLNQPRRSQILKPCRTRHSRARTAVAKSQPALPSGVMSAHFATQHMSPKSLPGNPASGGLNL